MTRSFLFLFFLTLLFACNEPKTNEKVVEEIKADDVANIIRNPVSASDIIDPDFVPKMTFEETTFDFGTIKEGRTIEHTFKFKNTGEVPLLINDARSTCGCTVPSYTEKYVKPGDKGEIKVAFNTKGLTGAQAKPITIVANTNPRDNMLHIKGIVLGDGDKHNH